MKISIPKENRKGETRVAASPEVVRKFVSMGFSVTIESGAGLNAGFTDEIFKDALEYNNLKKILEKLI